MKPIAAVIDIGICATEPRGEADMVACRIGMVPSDGADPRDEAEIVADEDEEKDRAEEPEGALCEVRPHQSLKEDIKGLDGPLGEVLEAGGDEGHFPGGHAAEEDDQADGDPDHDHRVGDRQPIVELLRIERQHVGAAIRSGESGGEAEEPERGCFEGETHGGMPAGSRGEG